MCDQVCLYYFVYVQLYDDMRSIHVQIHKQYPTHMNITTSTRTERGSENIKSYAEQEEPSD